MGNILAVLIIAFIIWAFSSFKPVHFKYQPPGLDKKTQTEVNQVVTQTEQQVNYAKQLQRQESNNLETNNQ